MIKIKQRKKEIIIIKEDDWHTEESKIKDDLV